MSFLRERMTDALTTETMRRRHLRRVMEIEEGLYPRPWTHRTFVTEISLMREGARYYLVAYVHVTNVAVDPDWQGRGVATEIMLDLVILARDRGCLAMTLEVRHTNTAAQQLYRRFGFVPAGIRKKYYENKDDAIIMWAHGIDTPEFLERVRLIESRRP
jgi:ribosomal-protein-alanine N-acetyltransferase